MVLASLALWAPGCDRAAPIVAPTLSATCSAAPSSGAAPLAVSFNLNVAGAQGPFTVAISYGDGATGSDPGSAHTFASGGVYTVSFTVRTATQSALCSASVSVSAAPPPPPPQNQAPEPIFRTTPAAGPGNTLSGPAPFTVRYDLCRSTDPEQDRLYFTMDFEGDGRFDVGGTTGAQCRRSHSYPAGTYQPRMCITDLGEDGVPMHPYLCVKYALQAN